MFYYRFENILFYFYRKRGKAAGQFRNIVKAVKLGALKGAKAKRNKNK